MKQTKNCIGVTCQSVETKRNNGKIRFPNLLNIGESVLGADLGSEVAAQS